MLISKKENTIKKISVVIPVYNGAKTVSLVVDAIIEVVSGSSYDLEIVLVNDASPADDSEEVCSKLAASHQFIKFINLSKNVGEHNAVIAGLNYCSGDCAVIMDDDFQNPPEELLKLVCSLEEGNDVAFSYYKKKQHHFIRNLGSRFNNWIASILIGKPFDLYLSSFKAINRFLIDEIIKYKGSYPYIDGLILRSSSRYSSVLVRHNRREEGESGYTFKKLVSLWLNMFTNFSILPLRIATIMGFVMAIFSGVMIIIFSIEKFNNPHIPVGWASTMVSIFLLGSVQLFTIGMMGEYLGRLFLDAGGKPQYVVRSTMNCDEEKGIDN